MTEHVLLYLLSNRLFQATYHPYQAERRWQEHVPPFPGDIRIAVLGLGAIGQRVAEIFVNLGYQVNGGARSPHQIRGWTAITDAISWPPVSRPATMSCASSARVRRLPDAARRAIHGGRPPALPVLARGVSEHVRGL